MSFGHPNCFIPLIYYNIPFFITRCVTLCSITISMVMIILPIHKDCSHFLASVIRMTAMFGEELPIKISSYHCYIFITLYECSQFSTKAFSSLLMHDHSIRSYLWGVLIKIIFVWLLFTTKFRVCFNPSLVLFSQHLYVFFKFVFTYLSSICYMYSIQFNLIRFILRSFDP